MPHAFPRAHDGAERCVACALPDLREFRAETHRTGTRAYCVFVDLARLSFTGAPVRAVPAQIFLASAETLLWRRGGTLVCRLRAESFSAGRKYPPP